jgi:uncharacterized protein
MPYIDTSVLVAYYCPEPLSEAAQKAIGASDAPVVSPLVELELYSALAAKVRERELDAVAARLVLAMFHRHQAQNCYLIVPIGAAEYAQARDWIGRFSTPLRAADALHLAAALGNGLTLLTADRALARSARVLDVECDLIG